MSPGGWTPPPGVLPAWNWVPPDGAKPRLDVVPWWVRLWYELPLIDRYAHGWMPRIGQQPIQHGQLRRQLTDLHRQQLIEQRLDLVTRQPQHPRLPPPNPTA